MLCGSLDERGVWGRMDTCICMAGFPGGSGLKNSPAHAGDAGLIPGSGKSPGGGNGNSLQYFCLGKILWTEETGRGYSPWGHQESGLTVTAHTHTCMAGPLRCSPEAMTTLLTVCISIQNKKFFKKDVSST